MNSNIPKTLVSIGLLGGSGVVILLGCGAEDPGPSPTGTSGVTASAGTPGAAGPTTGGVAATTGAASTTGGGPVTNAVTSAVTGAASTTGVAATTGGATTGGATTGSATTGGATTGGGTTDGEQCSGISNGAVCSTPGECAPRACGIADSGSRTCSCATNWDCTSCSWPAEPGPYAEEPAGGLASLPACGEISEGVEDGCTPGTDMRCVMGTGEDAELCVCWAEDGNAWDCDNPPSFWAD